MTARTSGANRDAGSAEHHAQTVMHRDGASARSPRTRCLAAFAVLLTCVVLTHPTTAQANENTGDFGLAGNDRILWAYQPIGGMTGQPLIYFAFLEAEATRRQFRRLPISGITGTIRAATVRGDDLHAFFTDGTHRRYAPVAAAGNQTMTAPAQFVERTLPDGAVPEALTADPATESLYALVRRNAPDDAAPDQPATAGWAIHRYHDGNWNHERNAPPDLAGDLDLAAIAANDQTIHLVYREATHADLNWRVSTTPDDDWTAPRPLLNGGADVQRTTLGWRQEELLLAATQTDGTEVILTTTVLTNGQWRDPVTLLDENAAPARFAPPIAFSLFEGKIAVAGTDSQNRMTVSLWSPEDGRLVAPPIPAFTVVPRTNLPAHRLDWHLLQYALILGVLTIIFVRRRAAVLAPTPLPAGLTFAPLSHRLTALVIDLAITSPLWALIIWRLWRSYGEGLTPAEQLALPPDAQPPVTYWSGAIVGGVYATYGAFFEGITRTTPGKRITGCWVTAEGGQPCGVMPILLRNALRVIEFHLLAIALIVLFTPARQRVGDLIGRTIVVTLSGQPAATGEASADTDRPDKEETGPRNT